MSRIVGWRLWLARRVLGPMQAPLLKEALDDEIRSDQESLRRSIVSQELERIDLVHRIRAERQKLRALQLIEQGIYDYEEADSH